MNQLKPVRACPNINRRDFIKLMALASAAAAMPPGLISAAQKIKGSAPKASVSLAGVARQATAAELLAAVRQAAEAATDFSWLSRGDSVLIKPVVNSGNPYPATTSTIGLQGMIALLKEKGAGRVMVSDMSGIEHVKLSPEGMKGSTRELMKSCGVAQATEAAGGELFLPEEEGWGAFFEDGPATAAHWKSGILMPKIIKEVDHVVLLPRCGRHALLGASLGMKAAVGYWRTDTRLEYHRDAGTIQEKTAEANTVASLREKQRLTLTVADKVLTTFGPDKGHVLAPDTGLVLASESLIAHDMVSLAWLLEARRAVPEDRKKGREDPYSSQFMVNMANKYVVGLLGGFGQAVTAEKLTRNDLETIWEDRVLQRAFQLSGGIPKLDLIEANSGISAGLQERLRGLTTPTVHA